jgi:WD40 repeat protein/tetratricopeptide (TPR) repeat protein
LLASGFLYNAKLQTMIEQVEAQKEEAGRERAAAKEARVQATAQLGWRHVSNAGWRLDSGDAGGALALIAEAITVDGSDRMRQEEYRIRFRTVAQRLPKLVQVFHQGGGLVRADFSPDGHRVLTVGKDRAVRLWDVVTGQSLPLSPPGDDAVFTSVSPDGRRVFTASGKRAYLWDAATGEKLRLMPLDAELDDASFSPDSRQVLTASGRTAFIWDLSKGKPVTLLKHDLPVVLGALSPDGCRLLTVSSENPLALLFSGSAKMETCIWDPATGQRLSSWKNHGRLFQVSFFPGGPLLLGTSSGDDKLRVWDAATGKQAGPSFPHQGRISCASLNPDGRRVIWASGRTAQVWDVPTTQPLTPPLAHHEPVEGVAFSLDGQGAVTTSSDGIRVWDATKGQLRLPLLKGNVAEFSPNGRYLLTHNENEIRIWDMASEPLQRATRAGDRKVPLTGMVELIGVRPMSTEVNVRSPDGRYLLKVKGTTARLFAAATGLPVSPVFRHKKWIEFAVFSPDSRRVVTWEDGQELLTDDGGAVRVWDTVTGKEVFSLQLPQTVSYIAFSPNGRHFLTAISGRGTRVEREGKVQVWDAATGQSVGRPLKGKNGPVAAAFSPDSRRIAITRFAFTGGQTDTQIVDVLTGQPLTPPLTHPFPSMIPAFSADGRRIVTADPDRERRRLVWDVSPDDRPVKDLVALAQLLSGRVVQEAGGFTTLSAGKSRQLWETMKANFPEEFAPPSRKELLAWWERQAKQSETNNDWFAARFYLDLLMRENPKRVSLYVRRGKAQGELGQWKQAAADYERALQLSPGDLAVLRGAAMLRLHAGDQDGYRQARQRLLKHLQPGAPTAWVCALGDRSHANLTPVVRLAEKSLVGGSKGYQDTLLYGATLYRAGRFQEAVKRLDPALKLSKKYDPFTPLLYLAMAHHRLGHVEKARQYLDQAVRGLDEAGAKVKGGPFWSQSCWYRLELQILRREAEALLKKPAADPKK